MNAKFLEPVSESRPCGENIAYDPLVRKIAEEIKGRTDMKVDESGHLVAITQDPEWRPFRALCEEALSKSKDLNVCIHYIVALMQTDGIAGLAEGLELLAQMLRKYWPDLYPALDPDESNPACFRFGILENLTTLPTGMEEGLKFIHRLQAVPLCKSPRLGAVSLASLGGASLDSATDGARNAMAALQEINARKPGDLGEALGFIERSIAAVNDVDEFLSEATGSNAPSWEVLHNVLKEQKKLIDSVFNGEGGAGADAGADAVAGNGEQPVDAGNSDEPSTGVVVTGAPGAITSRADVLRCLDLICKYYEKAEPSSPVPFLLQRTKRLVKMSFVELINNMAPSAMEQIISIIGNPDEADSGKPE